jgi:small subunit ribosomal protein S8
MNITDPIADMLTRIRNAQMVNKPSVQIPASRLKMAIAQVLKTEGYISDVAEVSLSEHRKVIEVTLKYYRGKPVIERLQRVSRPGLRAYRGKDALPRVQNGLGAAIVSTSKGMMTDAKARELGLGGEVICLVA